ncbi:c-type cytochrome [Thiomicrorhabdus lithotrophica]|uniref:C-type cytochrome n=1 Tax=Thiomicrorhabdus lithotrophica TaxID=2949997 RepID=A0ABY8C6V2_9GAMM|nr:c-type cytochrome [Thiomicrorhabdus lithotrophica]WEJ61703.1 c-type cytochrome [Thiomicrorhabdus lithotrophica]
MKKRFNVKTVALSTALLGSAVFLAGCSGDTEEAKTAAAPAAEQNTMDVKQPVPVAAPKAALQPAPAPAPVAEVPAAVEEKVEEVKEVVAAVAAPSGEKAYATCVGCHGAKGEGGVGPRLNNQTVDDVVAKLEKYKAGEQVGPMTGMMAPMAAGLSAEDMKVIAEYVTTL